MSETDGLVIFDGDVDVHVVPVDLDVDERVLKAFDVCFRCEESFALWVRMKY
jgi:hypothetical protein